MTSLDQYSAGPLALADYESHDVVGTSISLFSGAGGLDLGAHAAGFGLRAANEINEHAADALEKNFPGVHVDRRSVLEVTPSDLLDRAGLDVGELDLLIGGPPCTPFSKSGYWLEWKREGLDPDASLLQSFTRVLLEAKPRTFVMENVYALTFNNKASRPAFDRLRREIRAAGYTFTWQVLNAADHGVPQARPRLFVVGVRADLGLDLPKLPTPSHAGSWEGRKSGAPLGRPHITTAQALDGLQARPEPGETVAGRFGHLLDAISPGDNYLHYTAKRGHPDPLFEWRSRYWSFLLKLDPERPAPTIQAQPGPYVGPFHWENRRLRVPELKRLFTFPDDYEFAGSRNAIQSQIGNSVPPVLAYKVIREVAKVLG